VTLNAPPPAIYDALAKCTRLRSVLLIETPEGGQTARLGLLERRQDVEVAGGSVGRRGVEVDKSHLDLGPVRPDLLKVRGSGARVIAMRQASGLDRGCRGHDKRQGGDGFRSPADAGLLAMPSGGVRRYRAATGAMEALSTPTGRL